MRMVGDMLVRYYLITVKGHQTIAQVAEYFLDDQAAAYIKSILGSQKISEIAVQYALMLILELG